MHLTDTLRKEYSKDTMRAGEAQRLAHIMAMGPMVFQTARLMVSKGIFAALEAAGDKGLTQSEIAAQTGLSAYGTKVLVEGALTLGMLTVDDADSFHETKLGWFLQNDKMVRVNIDFNQDVNYAGMEHLGEAIETGKPTGLKELGTWPTIYEGLSSLPAQVQKSWFGFDHYYSDVSFDEALKIVFSRPVHRLMDVGGNTGRFAMRCVAYDANVRVGIVDLPQQIGLMKANTQGAKGADRIDGVGCNLLDPASALPEGYDVIWMSQFLDCFSEDEIFSIVSRAARVMTTDSRLFVMETYWDRQHYATAAADLTMTSLYFTAMANGNSKMYHSEDMTRIFERTGLEVVEMTDGLGTGHTLVELRLKR